MTRSSSKRHPRRGTFPVKTPGRKTQQDPSTLTTAQALFVEAYVANGGNGTRAYKESHPAASLKTAAQEAWRLLRDPKIRPLIEERRAERFARLKMQGDEALALLAMRARADIADAFDDDGKMLPVEQWPESLRLCVKDVDGEKIRLYDGLKAAELLAVQTGVLKTNANITVNFDHATYLAGLDEPPEPPDEKK